MRRFVWSIGGGEPDPDDEAWLVGQLSTAEAELYEAMSANDRRHAVLGARLVADRPRDVVVAAALHDVGKTPARLGTLGRVGATLAGLVPLRWGGRVGRYLDHAEVGAAMLEAAGSDPLVVAWAREHHLPPRRWTVPPDVGRALVIADG